MSGLVTVNHMIRSAGYSMVKSGGLLRVLHGWDTARVGRRRLQAGTEESMGKIQVMLFKEKTCGLPAYHCGEGSRDRDGSMTLRSW